MNSLIANFGSRLGEVFIEPHSLDTDSRRREFILNTLLTGLFVVATVAVLNSLVSYFITFAAAHQSAVWSTAIFWAVIVCLIVASRRGHPVAAAYTFAGFLLLSAVYFAVSWGFGLAQAELFFALTIVIAGVLFTARVALIATLVITLCLIVVTFLQVNELQQPLTYWQNRPFSAGDAVGYGAVFIIIGLVSWLSNREIDRSLQRAKLSEAALQKERDSLEAKVIERTHELEDLQLARLLEMQPFAEFGRIGASLVHEIANPLTAASLQLEALDKEQHSDLVRQVQRNLNQLERYLLAARKQIKRESRLTTFTVSAELRQVVNISKNRARRANVVLEVSNSTNMKLYGDAVKFNQLVANLLANAIDASQSDLPQPAVVRLQVTEQDNYLVMDIIDHGIGISESALDHLFEPFYSTKKNVRSGLGIGLTMVKQYVEHDFRGSVKVASSKSVGTVFTVRLRSQERH